MSQVVEGLESAEVAVSLISFKQSLDLIEQADEEAREQIRQDQSYKYLNTMVLPADRKMVKAIKRRTGLSEGHIVREIFSQWREFQLRGCNDE